MTSKDFSIEVVNQLTSRGFIAYWAGGCVRDLLLGKEPHDFDVATNATPDQVREIFGHKRTLAVGESFGVIIVLGPKPAGHIEVATFRKEGTYQDGRRPDSVEFCTPQEDSQRRDFTINGMFFDPVQHIVHDYVGGEIDLQARVVRAIGNPDARMEEDKLRLLRAVRFTAVLDFQLDDATASAVRKMASQIIVVSAERIAQELRKMLAHAGRARAVDLCRELGLLDVILPEVTDESFHHSEQEWNQRLDILAALPTESFEMAMAVLLQGIAAPKEMTRKQPAAHTVPGICRRLKLSNDETEQITWLVQNQQTLQEFPEWSLAQRKTTVIQKHFTQLLEIERTSAEIRGDSVDAFREIDCFLSNTPEIRLNPPELLNGRDLIELGFKPGKQFQVFLNAVREAQLNEQIETPEQAVELVKSLEQRKS